jgi:putative aldouronate transport system permease protein
MTVLPKHVRQPVRLRRAMRLLRLDFVLYVMLLPTLVYFFVFRVLPIINMRLAFYNFSGRSAWTFAGDKYFKMIFASPLLKDILFNTLIISFMKYVLLFPFFALFAILLSEMRLKSLRNVTQVVSYLPHFLSWVVIAGIWISTLSKSGAVNQLRGFFGASPIDFMTDKGSIRWILFYSEGWRSLGWDSIVYFTAIITISPSLYEAADIDGASRLQMIRYVVLPALLTPMVTMFILNLGFFLNAGFDQVLNFTNAAVNSRIEILDTYIYSIGLGQGQYSLATAVGLVKGLFGVVLVLCTHLVSKRLTGTGVW